MLSIRGEGMKEEKEEIQGQPNTHIHEHKRVQTNTRSTKQTHHQDPNRHHHQHLGIYGVFRILWKGEARWCTFLLDPCQPMKVENFTYPIWRRPPLWKKWKIAIQGGPRKVKPTTILLVTFKCVGKIQWFLAGVNCIQQEVVWCKYYANFVIIYTWHARWRHIQSTRHNHWANGGTRPQNSPLPLKARRPSINTWMSVVTPLTVLNDSSIAARISTQLCKKVTRLVTPSCTCGVRMSPWSSQTCGHPTTWT